MKKTLILLIIGLSLSSCNGPSLSEQLGKDVKSITEDFNKGYKQTENNREYIGMTATILYLKESNQIDSVKIDLRRLLQIQDSLALITLKRLRELNANQK